MTKMATDGKTANLNLKVTEDERWAFKELCVRHRMSQVDGFRMAVRLLSERLDASERSAKSSASEGGEHVRSKPS